jgi:hypothetical protein
MEIHHSVIQKWEDAAIRGGIALHWAAAFRRIQHNNDKHQQTPSGLAHHQASPCDGNIGAPVGWLGSEITLPTLPQKRSCTQPDLPIISPPQANLESSSKI